MPNPNDYADEKEFMAACVPMRIKEGDKQDQAAAVCMSMWKERAQMKSVALKYNDSHDERGQFSSGDGGGGGGSAGGDSGGSSGGSSADVSKARAEFHFLDKRLAAGNLKRGERKSIQKRQEALAKIVFGVKEALMKELNMVAEASLKSSDKPGDYLIAKNYLDRAEALTVMLKQFDPSYAQEEAWNIVTASGALSQLSQLAGGEAEDNEPDHVAMLGKIMTALTKFINEEIAEMVKGEEQPDAITPEGEIENGPMVPAMMEAKPTIIDRLKAIFKQGARHNSGDQKMLQTIHDHASSLGADCSMSVKQMADGAWRWVLLSSNAYRDKDKEIISTKALEDDCVRADADGYYGPLRWWHIGEYDMTTKQAGPGADLGVCDFNAMHGRILIESGTFKSEAIARAVQKQAANLESSIGFFHPLTEPDGEGTYTSIRRFERSLLPKGKAANPLTALTVITKETQAMKKEKLEALNALLGNDEAAEVVKQAEVVQKAADDAGLTFKSAESEPPEVATPEPITADTLKELTDNLAASLAPVIEAKVKEQIGMVMAAYTLAVETKATGQQAQIDKVTAVLKELLGDLPRNASRGVVLTDSDHNIVSDETKTKGFNPALTQEQFPLQNFSNWITGANPA